MFQGPRNSYIKEIEQKQQEIIDLKNEASIKNESLINLQTELDRYKVQVESLTSHMSEVEMQNSALRDRSDKDKLEDERKRLQGSLDMQKNVTKC